MRSDVCVVPAAAIVGEAMVRLALTAPVLEKYGGDSMEETLDNLRRSREAADATLCARAVKRHVALVGFMASGKSTIGRKLARRLGCAFFDTDELVVRAHGPIPAIFADEGEAAFRRYERARSATRLEGLEASVVALGGGALTRRREPASADATRLPRLHQSLAGTDPRARAAQPRGAAAARLAPTLERIKELYATRMPEYANADHVVEADAPQRPRSDRRYRRLAALRRSST